MCVSYCCTLDDSHCTQTTEIVQAIKCVEENIEDRKEMKIWDQQCIYKENSESVYF